MTEEVFGAVVDAVLAAERRIGRRLVRDLCAAQFRPDFAQDHDVGKHPLGLMLVDAIAHRVPEIDPIDLAMVFLTGLFGLLATDDGLALWKPGRTQRVSSGFYTSQAFELKNARWA